jgi:hypothetical protein
MAISVRTFLRTVIGMVAAFVGGSARAQQRQPAAPEKLTLSAFIARVRSDPALRARFADDPRSVLREHGIDPTPYNVPDRMSDERMERLLADLARAGSPSQGRVPDGPAVPPAPVYGPPPGPPRQR